MSDHDILGIVIVSQVLMGISLLWLLGGKR